MGNWDTAGYWGTRELGPVVTVAGDSRPEEVYAEFLAFRESLGMTILPLTGGGDVFAQLRGHLTRPVVMPLLADRDLTARGIDVDLCGHRAHGRRTGRPRTGNRSRPPPRLHPLRGGGRVVANPGRHHLPRPGGRASGTTRERATAMTQQCADVLGTAIHAHTADWHMLQRVFVEDLDLQPRHDRAAP